MHLIHADLNPGHSEFSHFIPYLKNVDWRLPLAVAVSGGGDSMALLASLIHLRQSGGLLAPLHVLTVDHDLREGSDQEAEFVGRFCAQHGASHAVMDWEGLKPTTAIAERARMARRRLLVQACRKRGVSQLLMAHTMDDVAETLLMRVRRGGLRGHASIAPETQMSDVRIFRPFLPVRRNQLRMALVNADIRWFDDPTNENLRYERPRVRRTLQKLDESELSISKIASYATLMGRWRSVMAQHIARIVALHCKVEDAKLLLPAHAIHGIPRVIAVELVRELVRFVGGDAYMVDFSQANDVVSRMRLWQDDTKAISSGRCVLRPSKGGLWKISRAGRDLPTVSVQGTQSICWDGRFVVEFDDSNNEAGEITPPDGFSLSDTPIVRPKDTPHKIAFRPRVLDGPVASFDEPLFTALEALISVKTC